MAEKNGYARYSLVAGLILFEPIASEQVVIEDLRGARIGSGNTGHVDVIQIRARMMDDKAEWARSRRVQTDDPWADRRGDPN